MIETSIGGLKNNSDVYFAADKPEICAANLLQKGKTFYNNLTSNFYIDKLRRAWSFYHGAGTIDLADANQVTFTGEQGELVSLNVNHFRNLAQHILVMITANRPILEARAINNDYRSKVQTYLANGILDYYMREKNLEKFAKDACELAVVTGAGFLKMEWNSTAGEAYDIDPETGEFNKTGEIEFSTLTILDVVFDGTKDDWNKHDWIMCRTPKNRHDLLAKYPEYKDKIKSLPGLKEVLGNKFSMWSNDDTDDIFVYEFFHKPTDASPEGRYMLFLDADVVLLDTSMPYRRLPIFRMSAGKFLGTSYSYTSMFDIIPLQEMLNSLVSAVCTNQSAFAVQNVWIKSGDDIVVESIVGGMNVVKSDEPPQPLNLVQTPEEVFNMIKYLEQTMETLAGVNSVARGNPEASLKSGTALALVQSMALQFQSGLQGEYVKFLEDAGTSLLDMLKDFADTPKTIALVGKANRTKLKEFTGDDLSSISRVIVDVGNPLSRSIAGRVQMAEQMLQMNLIKTPEQYFQVITTGRLEALFDSEFGQLMLITSENERLAEGDENVIASYLDRHSIHIKEHMSVLNDPELRSDNELVMNVQRHIQEHIDLLRDTDPAVLAIIGEAALPPNPMSMDQLAMAPANGGPGGPPPGGPGAPPPGGPGAPPQGGPQMPQAPSGPPGGAPPLQGGVQGPEGNIIGPNGQGVPTPNMPQVDPALLPNPALGQMPGSFFSGSGEE